MSELLPETDERIDKMRKIHTSGFPTRELTFGSLYLTIGTTNGGKTIFTWAEAITLALEGLKVAVISTEDNMVDLRTTNLRVSAKHPAWDNISFLYADGLNKYNSRELFEELARQKFDIICFDYIRPDIWETTHDNIGLTMSEIMTMFRDALHHHDFIILATIQANSNMYKDSMYKMLSERPHEIVKSIEGGVKAPQRSSVVSLLVENKQGKRGNYIFKMKGEKKDIYQGKVVAYGSVDLKTMEIVYAPPVSIEEFFGMGNKTEVKESNGPQKRNIRSA